MKHPRVRTNFVDVRKQAPESKPIEGKDFPSGIETLDLSWFERSINLESAAAAQTPDQLVAFRAKVEFLLWLRKLQKTSMEA